MSVTTHASTTRQVEFCGRDSELEVIRAALGHLGDGTSAVVVIEGGAGMGKSRLLAEVITVARSLGVRVGASAADPSESVVELAALLATLSDASSPLVDRDAFGGLRRDSGQRFWLLRDLESLLERAALEGPIMIAIDDVHWADSGTAAALRTLPIRLSGLPIAWIFAVRPPTGSTPMTRALDELRRSGATTVSLGPLDADATHRLTRGVLGGEADDHIRRLLDDTRGSPFLIVELLLGLRDEHRVHVEGGRAELVDGCLPSRVQDGMRERLGRLSEDARTVVTVAASLGRTFSFDELARTLGSPASEILAPVGELIATDLLVERDDKMAFWHDITREAVRASIPVGAARARPASRRRVARGRCATHRGRHAARRERGAGRRRRSGNAAGRSGSSHHDRLRDRRAVRPAGARNRPRPPSAPRRACRVDGHRAAYGRQKRRSHRIR
jgi:hypothetical protein